MLLPTMSHQSRLRYPVSSNPVFDTIQGEGAMIGVPMSFVRLAGCSVGCDGCDTDYSVTERLTAAEVVERLQRLPRREWVWLTGGEPTDHPLGTLVAALKVEGFRVALATSGVRAETKDGLVVREGTGRAFGGVDFLSVSPHGNPDELRLRGGNQINLVPGLGRLRLAEWEGVDLAGFNNRWVTPCDGRPGSVAECVEFVRRNQGFRLGVQAHRVWGVA